MEKKKQTKFDKFCDQIILAANSAYGRYIMEYLLETYDFDNQDEYKDDIKLCKTVRNENKDGYYDAWGNLIDNLKITYKGITYRIEQNEDVWFIPDHLEIPEEWYF